MKLVVGRIATIKCECFDSNYQLVPTEEIAWSIASQSSEGLISLMNQTGSQLGFKCLKAGKCTISATYTSGLKSYLEVVIESEICSKISYVKVSKTYLNIYEFETQTIEIFPIGFDQKVVPNCTLSVQQYCTMIAEINQLTNSKISIKGLTAGHCSFIVIPGDCEDKGVAIDVTVSIKPCITIPDKKVSGIVNIDQRSTTIGNFNVQNCSGGEANIEVSSDNYSLEVQSSGSDGSNYRYAAVVSDSALEANKLYSGKITAKSGNVAKQMPYYYYTFDSRLQQTRPAGCSGWTGSGACAARTSSVPQADAPTALNPALCWSGLNYELDPARHFPAVWNNKIIKMFSDGTGSGVECYDLSNKQLVWKTDDLANGSDSFRGPSIYKNYVFVTINSTIMALDANDGSTLWSWSESGEIVSANPVIANDKVFSGGNSLRCHDLRTGEVLWRKSGAGDVFIDLTIQSGVLAVMSLNIYLDDYATMYAYNCNTGEQLWQKFIKSPNLLSVFGPNSILLRYYDETSNKLTCYDSKTGELKWEYSIDGDTDWYAIPAVYDIYVILLNGKTITCIDSRNGHQVWKKSTQSQITNVPVIAGNRVYVCVEYEGVYTYDLKSGKLLANPFSNKPNDLLSWTDVIPAEGTLVVIYSSGYKSYNICCYTNNGRFKRTKISAVELAVNSKTLAVNNYNTYKNYTMPAPTQILNGVVCVPVKNVLDVLGGKLTKTSDGKYQILFGGKTLIVTPDKPQATVNGKQVQIDPKNPKVVPKLISGNLLVPSSFFAQSVGLRAFWENLTKTVIYTYQIIY